MSRVVEGAVTLGEAPPAVIFSTAAVCFFDKWYGESMDVPSLTVAGTNDVTYRYGRALRAIFRADIARSDREKIASILVSPAVAARLYFEGILQRPDLERAQKKCRWIFVTNVRVVLTPSDHLSVTFFIACPAVIEHRWRLREGSYVIASLDHRGKIIGSIPSCYQRVFSRKKRRS